MQTKDYPESGSNQRWKSCAVGCLAVVVGLIALAVILYYWFKTPGPQVPTDAFIGPETIAILHVEGLSADPAMLAMTQNVLSELQSVRKRAMTDQEIPAILRFMADWNREVREEDAQEALEDLPRDLTISLEKVEGLATPQYLASGNLNRFPRALKLLYFFVGVFQEAEEFKGVRILTPFPDTELSVAFVEHTLLWGPSPEVIKLALSRGTGQATAASSKVIETYQSREKEWNLYGVMENREGAINWLMKQLPDGLNDPAITGMEWLNISADVLDKDSIIARVELTYPREEEAEQAEIRLAGLFEEAGTRRDWLQGFVSRSKNDVAIDLKVSDVAKLIDRAFQETIPAPRASGSD